MSRKSLPCRDSCARTNRWLETGPAIWGRNSRSPWGTALHFPSVKKRERNKSLELFIFVFEEIPNCLQHASAIYTQHHPHRNWVIGERREKKKNPNRLFQVIIKYVIQPRMITEEWLHTFNSVTKMETSRLDVVSHNWSRQATYRTRPIVGAV